VALYAYTMQIYCDFSGYTDVARGSAMLMGIKLPENFKRPYKATSPAAFWRNWHMTLSSWLRDYVYFPLGGSRCSPARTYFNLWMTLFLIGIWHGAGWNFVVYGTIHGLAMVIHRYFYKRSGRTKTTVDPKWMVVLKIFGTFHFVVLSRILFRSDSLSSAWTMVTQLAKGTTSLAQISTGLWVLLGVTYLIHWLPVSWTENLKALYIRMPAVIQGLIFVAAAAVMVKLASTQVVPYIYFQF
jgi:alginate O-acetyltransferase complex protein AlgI